MSEASSSSSNVTVIGIGAMGGGMAHALLSSSSCSTVTGYDMNRDLVEDFYKASVAAKKEAGKTAPTTLAEAVGTNNTTNFVVLSLVNESQCEQVCFGGGKDGSNLCSLLTAGSCVICTSTVTATWTRSAQSRFEDANILFVDGPVSGGPVRAREGTLTMMVSGDEKSLDAAKPVLEAMGKEIHTIQGGAGMGSTAKMVHQLLAGVHICAAAESLSLAASAGLDAEQMYNIVNGAAGASWMFKDRGQRMLLADDAEVKSALDIFVKDLGIVHQESKVLKSPTPLASAALQQFISGQALRLGKKDDSQVIKVYETITGKSAGIIRKKNNSRDGDGDDDGTAKKKQKTGDRKE